MDYKQITKFLREYKAGKYSVDQAIEMYLVIHGPLSPQQIDWIKATYPVLPVDEGEDDQNPKDQLEIKRQFEEQIKVEMMKAEVSKRRITEQYEKYQEADNRTNKLKSMNFSNSDPAEVERLKEKNISSFNLFRDSKVFIGSMFNQIVPFTAKELILILGQTGGAKTTAMVNIAWATIKQKNPETGKFGNVLIISNEETELDILNRMACLAKLETGSDTDEWYYVDRAKFTSSQCEYLNSFIEKFKGSGLINIVDLDYRDEAEFTCYLENVKAILDQAAKDPGRYDCIILDYYQQIRYSLKRPDLNEYMVQKEFSSVINSYKEKVGCPIVIMAQMNEPSKDKSWKDRIVGTKAIAQPCTFIMEVRAKKSTYTTDWIIHKARYASSSIGKIVTGFKHGRIVPIDDAFQKWAKQEIEKKKTRETNQARRQADLDQFAETSNIDAYLKVEPSEKT